MDELMKPKAESIIYEDDRLYACLASFPFTKGHTIVAWKIPVPDLNLLGREDYEYLMDTVDRVRGALIKALNIEKVYLIYMDEAHHVHWHLVPRFNKKGFNIFLHEPKEITDFSLVTKIRVALTR